MFKISLKSLMSYKRRLVLTLFSIVLSVGFVAASFIFSDSIRTTFTGLFDDVFNLDVSVRPVEEEDIGFGNQDLQRPGSTIDETFVTTLQSVEGVGVLGPGVDGDVALLDKEGELIITQGPPILGFSWTTEPTLNPLRVKDGNGRPPEAPGEVVVDANTTAQYEFTVGDQISVDGPDGVEQFELVGIASFGDQDSLAGAIIVAFELSEAQRMFGLEDQLTYVDINAVDGVSSEELQARIATVLPAELEVVTGDQQSAEQIDDINEGLGFITTFLLVFAGLSMFVGAFIIQNTFRIVVAQRAKELALLRAVGASKKQVTRLVVVEAIVVGLIASLLGVAAGIGLAELLSFGLDKAGLGLPESGSEVRLRTVLWSLIVGVGVTVLSALVPALKASKVSPVAAIRGQVDVSRRKSLVKRLISGSILSALGAGLIWYGLFGDPDFNRLYSVGAGVAAMFIGVSVLSPLLVKPFVLVAGYPIRKIARVVGPISSGNTIRSPRRTAATASALMIGISLVTLVGVFAGTIKGTVDTIIEESFPADLVLRNLAPQRGPLPEGGVSYDLFDEFVALEEVGDTSAAYIDFARFDVSTPDKEDLSEDFIYAVDPVNFNATVSLAPDDPTYSRLAEDSAVFVNQDRLEDIERSVGDTIVTTFISGETVDLEIVGSFEEPFDSDFIVSLATYERYVPVDEYSIVFANYADSFNEETGRPAVDELIEKNPSALVQNAGELVEEAKSQIDQILALIWGLLAMTVVIAVLGIANTLTLSISERTREIGLLRAVGMTKRQVRRTIRLESVLLSLFGTVLGIAMGLFFAWALLKALEDEGLSGFVVSVPQLAIYIVIALIASFIASFIPSYRASNTSVLEAINYE